MRVRTRRFTESTEPWLGNNIGELLNIKAYSSISSLLRRVSRLKKFDTKIRNQIGKIQDTINKGQRLIWPLLNLEIEKIEVRTAEGVQGNCSLKHFREKDS